MMELELDELVLCLGVTKNEVHLIQIEDPECVKTKRLYQNENFVVGNWYREQSGVPKRYKLLLENIVPTTVVEERKDEGHIIIELVLPVFVAPDRSVIQQLYGQRICMNSDSPPLLLPLICPLFGPNGNHEYLPSVKWPPNTICPYSNELYALKVNLDFTIGKLPKFSLPYNIDQFVLQSWNFVKFPIVERLCGARTIGLVAEEVTQKFGDDLQMQFCLLLNKKSDSALAVLPPGKFTSVGQFRVYWQINLECYGFPVTIAIECPKSGVVLADDLPTNELRPDLSKVTSGKFYMKLPYEIGQFKMGVINYSLPWLGNLMDPHGLIDDIHEENTLKASQPYIQLQLHWYLPKKSVAWTVCHLSDQFDKQCVSMSANKSDDSNNGMTNHNNSMTDDDSRSTTRNTNTPSTITDESDGGDDNGTNVNNCSNKSAAIILPNQRIEGKIVSVGNAAPRDSITTAKAKDEVVGVPLPLNGNTKHAVAALVTNRRNLPSRNAVFLFWDLEKANFTKKCYAIYSRVFEPHEFGEWYELTYVNVLNTNKEAYIDVLKCTRTEKRCDTRNRNGISAQFHVKDKEILVMRVWHAIFPCKFRDYYPDGKWFPWLCNQCFPGLPTSNKVSPAIADHGSLDVVNNGELLSTDADMMLAKQINMAFSLEEEQEPMLEFQVTNRQHEIETLTTASHATISTSSRASTPSLCKPSTSESITKPNQASPPLTASVCETAIVKQQKRQETTFVPGLKPAISSASIVSRPDSNANGIQTSLAVLFTTRTDSKTNFTDSVFLIWDETQGKLAHRVYADSPEILNGRPSIGGWYRIEYKLSSHAKAIASGKNIFICSIALPQEEPCIETRVVNGICAQFKGRPKLIEIWHKKSLDSNNKCCPLKFKQTFDWWPTLCDRCFPHQQLTTTTGATSNQNEGIIIDDSVDKKKQKQWTKKSPNLDYTSSDDSTVQDDVESQDGSVCSRAKNAVAPATSLWSSVSKNNKTTTTPSASPIFHYRTPSVSSSPLVSNQQLAGSANSNNNAYALPSLARDTTAALAPSSSSSSVASTISGALQAGNGGVSASAADSDTTPPMDELDGSFGSARRQRSRRDGFPSRSLSRATSNSTTPFIIKDDVDDEW